MNYAHKIALGSVQFGMPYGATNKAGQVPQSEVRHILEESAKINSQLVIDTAPAYGNAEQVLGESLAALSNGLDFRLITKTTFSLPQAQKDFNQSLQRLKVQNVYGYMDHNAQLLKSDEGKKAYAYMSELKAGRKVQKIGATVYSIEDVLFLLERYRLDIIQLPLNVLDQRWQEEGILQRLKQNNIEIHARSLFLQGVLLEDAEHLSGFFQPYQPFFENLEEFCQDHGFTKAQACLYYALSLKEVDQVVLGALSWSQFQEHLDNAQKFKDSHNFNFKSLSCPDSLLLNPSQWPQRT